MSAIQVCIDYARKNQLGKPQDKQSAATQAAAELAALRAVVEAARKLLPEYRIKDGIVLYKAPPIKHIMGMVITGVINEIDILAASLARVDGVKPTVCPSCTWRGDVELENGVCPQCDVDWWKLAEEK